MRMTNAAAVKRAMKENDATYRKVGAAVRALRAERGLGVPELAACSKLSIDAIYRIERGTTAGTLETIGRIASTFGMSFQAFFERVAAVDYDDMAPGVRIEQVEAPGEPR